MPVRSHHLTLFAVFALTAGNVWAEDAFSRDATLRQPAHVEPYERANIVAKASGFVSTVHVDIGDEVKKGQILAELSIPEMKQELLQKEALVEKSKAAIRQADAGVTSATAKIAAAKASASAAESQVVAAKAQLEMRSADIAFAESEFSRITRLVSSRAVTEGLQEEKQQQLRSAKASMSSTQADVQSAQSHAVSVRSGIQVADADLKLAEADLVFAQSQSRVAEAALAQTVALMEYATIRAPFEGRISQRGIDPGDFVMSAADAKGEPLFTLNRVDKFRIIFDVPESSANLIKLGQKVELRLDSMKSHVFTGQIKRTTGQLDSRTRTLRVEAAVDEHDGKLQPGMFGMVTTIIE